MSGVAIQVDGRELTRLNHLVEALLQRPDTRELMTTVGAVTEAQTRRRIEEDKRGPDGRPWDTWADDYARTRHQGQSLLVGDGDLLDSLHYEAGREHAEVGSNLVYAAIHQLGGRPVGKNIPERPYLGLSDDDEAELQQVVDDWLNALSEDM